MTRTRILSTVVALCLAVAGGNALAADSAELKALHEAAKKEGKVLLAAGMPPKTLKALQRAFNKRFPGVKAKVIASTGSNAASRILTETKVGNATIEVAQATTSSGQPLLDAGLVQSVDYAKTFGVPKQRYPLRQPFRALVRPGVRDGLQHQEAVPGPGAHHLGGHDWRPNGRDGSWCWSRAGTRSSTCPRCGARKKCWIWPPS